MDLSSYIQHHLLKHADPIGKAIRLRFTAIQQNPFISSEDLDEVSLSPYTLNPSIEIEDTPEAAGEIEKYGISRALYGNYTCHWKSRFIQLGLIQPSSLTFQEDEAMIYSALGFPNPVPNWKLWPTLYTYCLKLQSSVHSGSGALSCTVVLL